MRRGLRYPGNRSRELDWRRAPTALDPSAPITEQLARTFPVPKPQPNEPPGAAAAIKAGRKACRGKTPIEVREEFIEAAEGLSEDQEKIIGELPKYEKQSGNSSNFAAGQLGAGVYEATLPEKQTDRGISGLRVRARAPAAAGTVQEAGLAAPERLDI